MAKEKRKRSAKGSDPPHAPGGGFGTGDPEAGYGLDRPRPAGNNDPVDPVLDAAASGWLAHEAKSDESPEDRIREGVEAALQHDFFVDAAGIGVSVRNDTVTLSGMVNNADERRRAQDIAREAPGVMAVENQLSIRVGETGATGTGAGQPPKAVPEDGRKGPGKRD